MLPETPDSLDNNDSAQPLVVSLLAKIDGLLDEIKALTARIAELEARNGTPPKTPDNSSLPPSRGQKSNVAPAPAAKKKRKGRPGVARALCPDPDETRDIYADTCGHCGAALSPDDQLDAFAYDHIDIPPIKPRTTRINVHKGLCPCCKKRVTAKAPADMPPGSPFGPGIVSIAAYLHGCHMVSYARLTEVFDGLLGLKISEGAIANDETSARVNGKTWWQWAFSSTSAVYHTIEPTRGRCVPTEFLGGARPKVWISDRLAAQCKHADAHQVCLAHLIRDAQYAIDAGDDVFAPGFKAFLKKACAIGRRRVALADATIARYSRELSRELDRLLDLESTNTQGNHLRAAIAVDARHKLLVFLDRRDVEPTNNTSDRELRPSVIFRNVTNGFRSM